MAHLLSIDEYVLPGFVASSSSPATSVPVSSVEERPLQNARNTGGRLSATNVADLLMESGNGDYEAKKIEDAMLQP